MLGGGGGGIIWSVLSQQCHIGSIDNGLGLVSSIGHSQLGT